MFEIIASKMLNKFFMFGQEMHKVSWEPQSLLREEGKYE